MVSEFVQVQSILLSAEEGVQGLGFGISGSRNSGIVVRAIFGGGVAEREGSLRHGDHLLAVDDVRLWGMASEQVASILRQSTGPTRLVVARPVDPSSAVFLSNSVVVPTKSLADPADLDAALEASIQSANTSPIALAAAAGFNLTLAESHLPERKLEIQFVNGMAIPAVTVLATDAMGADEELNRPMVENVVLPVVVPSQDEDEDDHDESTFNYDNLNSHEMVVPSTPPDTDLTITVPSLEEESVSQTNEDDEPRLDVIVESSVETSSASVSKVSRPRHVRRSLSLLKKNDTFRNRGIMDRKMSLPTFGRRVKNDRRESSNDDEGEQEDDTMLVLPEKEEYTVELIKDDKGLGITVAGYVCEKESLSGIFVKSVIPDSMADKSGCIMVNDQITKVDGISLSSFTNQEAVELLKCTGRVVRLTVARYFRGLTFEELNVVVDESNTSSSVNSHTDTTITIESQTNSEDTLPSSTKRVETPTLTLPTLSSMTTPSTLMSSSLWSHQKRRKASLPPCLTQPSSRLTDRHLMHRHSDQLRSNTSRESKMEENKLNVVVRNCINLAKRSHLSNVHADTIRRKWQQRMGSQLYIIVACFQKSEMGLGISLEGTVDVEGGMEVRPKHYIRSVLKGGAVDLDARLLAGDQLLEVNGVHLDDIFHDQVVAVLKALPMDICMVCARPNTNEDDKGEEVSKEKHMDKATRPSKNVLSGSLQSLMDSKEPDLLLKARSEVSLCISETKTTDPIPLLTMKQSRTTTTTTTTSTTTRRSRSLEALNATAVWGDQVDEIVLNKGERGLGFSILDYQDPQNVSEKVIVIRSLIPGGEAAQDGRLVPGDRLLYVNNVSLEKSSLDTAVQALKGADFGPVRIGVVRPLIQLAEQRLPCCPMESRQSAHSSSSPTSTVNGNSSYSSSSSASNSTLYHSSSSSSSSSSCGSSSPCGASWSSRQGVREVMDVSLLPQHPKLSIVLDKVSAEVLGINLEPLAFDNKGCLLKRLEPHSAVAKDQRLRVGDLLLYINHECLWGATSSQTRSILRRAHFVNAIPVVFVPEECLRDAHSNEDDKDNEEDNVVVANNTEDKTALAKEPQAVEKHAEQTDANNVPSLVW